MRALLPTGGRTDGPAGTTDLVGSNPRSHWLPAAPAPSVTDARRRITDSCSLWIRARIVILPSLKCTLPQLSYNSDKSSATSPRRRDDSEAAHKSNGQDGSSSPWRAKGGPRPRTPGLLTTESSPRKRAGGGATAEHTRSPLLQECGPGWPGSGD